MMAIRNVVLLMISDAAAALLNVGVGKVPTIRPPSQYFVEEADEVV